jgi:uncharacterized coiled-coil protein SlyX
MNELISRVVVVAALGVCLAFSTARAVTPAPDGGYPSGNTAEGTQALNSLTTGAWNTASGLQALFKVTTGGSNTATGVGALFNNTGNSNTAYGVHALFNITSGSNNIGIGSLAGVNLTTESNVIVIGHPGEAGEENYTRIGTEGVIQETYIAGIHGQVLTGDPVCVNNEGELGECSGSISSARFKHDIQSMDKASETIFGLKPVMFRYNQNIDPKGDIEFGLIAEEVAKVDPRLVKYDKEGKIHGVRHESVNAMLLNEFLKEHRTVEQLKDTVAKQQTIIAQQQKSLEAFAANLKDQQTQIQKVSAQLTATRPAPQVVDNR